MQTKQLQRNNHDHIQIETILTRNYILWWKILQQKIFNVYIRTDCPMDHEIMFIQTIIQLSST